MAIGPGKYDRTTTMVRNVTQARGVVVIVVDGLRGSGFSVQATADIVKDLPNLLRHVAEQIEENGP